MTSSISSPDTNRCSLGKYFNIYIAEGHFASVVQPATQHMLYISGAVFASENYSNQLTTIKYGVRSNEQIDIISPCSRSDASDTTASAGCALLAFLHGGYWQDGQ